MKAIALQAIHQPSGGILGHEVLVRQSVGGSWVGPGAFMAGSDSHAWVSMDHAVAELLIKHAADLRGRGLSFVNVSSHTLSDPVELHAVCKSLAKLAPMGIEVCVEVSESFDAIGSSFYKAMGLIKDQGLLLAMDDFGMECSNFNRLISYPWDFCKVDLNAVWNSDNLDWLIEVRDYCSANGIGLILEKLECLKLLGGLLKPLNSASVQGFALSKPFMLQFNTYAERPATQLKAQ
jgi:EAL domain-containing protein (putative c-di-GMP-specific phosphodiesterase class I)